MFLALTPSVARREPAHAGRIPSGILSLLCVPLLVTCTNDSGGAERGGGPRVVESSSPLWGTQNQWQVESEPALDLGVAEGAPAFEFETILGLTRLANGNIVVADD